MLMKFLDGSSLWRHGRIITNYRPGNPQKRASLEILKRKWRKTWIFGPQTWRFLKKKVINENKMVDYILQGILSLPYLSSLLHSSVTVFLHVVRRWGVFWILKFHCHLIQESHLQFKGERAICFIFMRHAKVPLSTRIFQYCFSKIFSFAVRFRKLNPDTVSWYSKPWKLAGLN